ncbi:hypothetical protein [Algoriphagus sp. CAU 1675]|uniref:hypothetical protein n=1 Tax=Algoriphagus sp. CAU 1675 TaxID=3032597 RepID=UPI0023DA4A73|nr:hypothetical protein [Algoriphagus sp. CAU 1675]MDF2157298.1 hypothetical protein [Algoriphagus sp. CAU 1675]
MKYIYLLAILSLFCCKKSSSQENKIEEYLDTLEIPKSNKVLIIYIDGCTSCFVNHKTLTEEASKNDEYQIIVVTKSRKKAVLLLGEDLIPKVYLDTDLIAVESGLVSGFPVVFSFSEDGRLMNVTQIDYSSKNLSLP